MSGRTLRAFHWTHDFAPLWLSALLVDRLNVWRLYCLVRGHSEYVEMDNVTVCCSTCNASLRKLPSSGSGRGTGK